MRMLCPILRQWMALLKFPLFSLVLYCYAFVQYCNVQTIQYNTMHKFVGALDNPQKVYFFCKLRYGPFRLNPENLANIWQIKWNWIRSMKFETVRIYFFSEFSVCCHPKFLLPWQHDITTSPLYSLNPWMRCYFITRLPPAMTMPLLLV